MNNAYLTALVALVLATSMSQVVPVIAMAAPIGSPLMLRSVVGPTAEPVQYRRGWRGGYRGGGVGIGIGAGIVGALIGGAIAGSSQSYAYYGPRSGYYAPNYAAPTGYYGGTEAYCLQRFKSYDPYSGSYLGYDGFRHPCP